MAGSLLGPDQVKKVNASFPALVKHIRALLAADHTGLGMMRVHCMVESFDSDEMAAIFRDLSFISPIEKKALVRAAIYQLLAQEPALFIAPEAIVVAQTVAATVLVKPEEQRIFTPPQFKLNVATSGAVETAKTDTKPEPKITSTHTPIVAAQVKAGADEQKAQQSKLDAAVAKLRAESAPKVVDVVDSVVETEVAPEPDAPIEE